MNGFSCFTTDPARGPNPVFLPTRRHAGLGLGTPALLYRVSRHCQGTFVVQDYTPGMLVRHPEQPDWGIGQIQSVIGDRITVNFQHAGKVLINGARIRLELVASARD